jgi:hypothetical protein
VCAVRVVGVQQSSLVQQIALLLPESKDPIGDTDDLLDDDVINEARSVTGPAGGGDVDPPGQPLPVKEGVGIVHARESLDECEGDPQEGFVKCRREECLHSQTPHLMMRITRQKFE